ncbi:34144_t:CDS:1, partial [Racocetra persica]
DLYIMTYGHAFARFIDNEFKALISSSLMVYDEFHEHNPDMISLIAA